MIAVLLEEVEPLTLEEANYEISGKLQFLEEANYEISGKLQFLR